MPVRLFPAPELRLTQDPDLSRERIAPSWEVGSTRAELLKSDFRLLVRAKQESQQRSAAKPGKNVLD